MSRKDQGKRTGNMRERGNKAQGRQRDILGTPYKEQFTDSNSTKSQRRAAEGADIDAKMSRENPLQYYTKFDAFAEDAASLPFAAPVGQKFSVTDIVTANGKLQEVTSEYVAPGVMRIEFVPAIGVSKDFSSAINRSSIRFYTYMRSNQKASASYDHQDITMMEVAMDSAYMFHGLMSKVYAIVNQFTPVNEYYSRATIAACGVSFDDIRMNLQDFRAYINAFAYSLGQYALPNDITLFDRHRWMVEGMYTDGETKKAQTYMFVPTGFWLYDNTVSTGSQCTYKVWLNPNGAATEHTFADIKAFGDALLNAISGDEDFAVISGDIYNFYGGATYKLPYIDENYNILPAYEEVVLSQIENATITGDLDAASLVISQSPSVNSGAIVFKPTLTASTTLTPGVQGDVVMNFHKDSPSPGDVIEASRLMVTTHMSSETLIEIEACGTEIVTGMTVFTRDTETMQFITLHYRHSLMAFNAAEPASAFVSDLTSLTTLAQFDWAPQVRPYYLSAEGEFISLGTTWDVDNYDNVPDGYINNIHLACLLSLFKVGPNLEG